MTVIYARDARFIGFQLRSRGPYVDQIKAAVRALAGR
jgi:hypothetical protein